MLILQLYASFFMVGLLTIGGGYASLPLIKEQTVVVHQWLTMTEFSDLITISEITPGPIAINAATFVGIKTAGLPGAIVATLGFVTAPFIIVSLLYWIYKKYRSLDVMQGILGGLRPAVVALIASAGLSILILALWGEDGVMLGSVNILSAVLMIAAFAGLRRFKPNPIFAIAGCGVAGVAAELIKTFF